METRDSSDGSVLRARDVTTRLRISRPTLWRWCREGSFPLPIRLGKNTIAWRERDIIDWLSSRPTIREGRPS
jgi:prophage regulatory protein